LLSGARNRLREAITVVATLLCALLLLRGSALHPGQPGLVDRLVLKAVAPLQASLAAGAQGVKDFGRRYLFLARVELDNEVLRRENRRLHGELNDARRASSERLRLEQLLALRASVATSTVSARVITLPASPYFRVVRLVLDRGAGEVEPGMPVVTAQGVVGRVSATSGRTSEVQLAVDPRSAIHVTIPRTGGRGLLVGKGGENGYRCRLQYLSRSDGVKPGDQVVTTGLGGFPRDLALGTVTRVALEPGAMFQDVEVTPAVDFARVSEVLVVLAPPAAIEQAPGVSSPAGGLLPGRGLSVYH
jgi:rod shape-determining protein MreC